MNRRKNINRRRPRARGNNNNLSATTGDRFTETRKLTRLVDVGLLSVIGGNVRTTWHVDDYLDRYSGTENLALVYDQYRIKKTELYCRLSNVNGKTLTSSYVSGLAILVDAASTSLFSAIDLDNPYKPVYDDVFTYQNMKASSITRNWRKVANYAPRCYVNSTVSQQGVLLPNSLQWLDTAHRDTLHYGYICAIQNSGGAINHGTTLSTCQFVEFMVVTTVDFRGRRITSGVTISIQPSSRTIENENELIQTKSDHKKIEPAELTADQK